MNLQGAFEPKTSDFSTQPHTVLPRQAEEKAQHPVSSAEEPPAMRGTGAVREGRRPLLQAGRRKARSC